MEIQKKRCPKCGLISHVLPSNNPLVEGICPACINKILDPSKVQDFTFFCRTYNYPLYLNTYMTLYKEHRTQVFYKYAEALVENNKLGFEDKLIDVWLSVEEEWSRMKTYTDILLRLPAARESFTERAKVKWGVEYSFAVLIQLENLFINTIKVYNITDPMRLDAIKKACKLSVKIDELIDAGDAKSIKDYTAAYQSFLKAAQIEDLGQIASENTIKTVSDLYKYMEKNGFEFKFYDKMERDIVDKTIKDIKESIRNEISNATGLDFKLDEIKRNLTKKLEDDVSKDAIEEKPLSSFMDIDYYEEVEMEADKEYEKQELDFEYEED